MVGGLYGEDIKRVFFSGNEETTICKDSWPYDVCQIEREKRERKKEKEKSQKREKRSKMNGARGVDEGWTPWDWFLGDPLGGTSRVRGGLGAD